LKSGDVYVRHSEFFYLADGTWRRAPLESCIGELHARRFDDVRVLEPRFKDIEIGGMRFRPNP
jgi:hypothetical protein